MDMSANVSDAELAQFHLSLDRCLADRTFLSRFYARFILSNDEVAAKFSGVDLNRQSDMLRTSLYMILRAAGGHDDGMAHLEDIAHSHSERGYDIGPHLYEHWLNCLLQVASETDPEFDAEADLLWRRVLGPCIQKMIARRAHG